MTMQSLGEISTQVKMMTKVMRMMMWKAITM